MFKPLNAPIKDWAGRRVWIVGASTGIGAALAEVLARAGARVALSARSADKLEALAARLPGSLALPLDVRDAAALATAFAALRAAWGCRSLQDANAIRDRYACGCS